MKRREFSIHLAGAGLALTAAAPALAQAPVEGTHYIKLAQPLAAALLPQPGKIDVTEFFWYECPHCNVFEPMLEAWVKKLPPDVAFRQVPVGFSARHQIHQRNTERRRDRCQPPNGDVRLTRFQLRHEPQTEPRTLRHLAHRQMAIGARLPHPSPDPPDDLHFAAMILRIVHDAHYTAHDAF